MSGERDAQQRLPFAAGPDGSDPEVEQLIASWRVDGPPTPWDAIVGHHQPIARCRELVAKLGRSEADFERLGLRLGRGVVLAGQPGVGKSMLACALASAVGRHVIAPPVAELTPGLIARLYAALSRMEPTVVILDEVERVAGQEWVGADADCVRALCVALDGVERPRHGPITVGLTTAAAHAMSPMATRPGRLAPRLELGLPTEADRRELLSRAIAGLPVAGAIDLDLVVARTTDWSGAELVVAVEEAISRSLPDGTDSLRQDLLLAVIAERYVIDDGPGDAPPDPAVMARHEAGHAICAAVLLGVEAVAVTEVRTHRGRTSLVPEAMARPQSAGQLLDHAAIALAGLAAERILGGADAAVTGTDDDRQAATRSLTELVSLRLPYDPARLEGEGESGRGSERMRAALHAAVEAEGAAAMERATGALAPHARGISDLADAILAAPDRVLSGPDLAAALRAALER